MALKKQSFIIRYIERTLEAWPSAVACIFCLLSSLNKHPELLGPNEEQLKIDFVCS